MQTFAIIESGQVVNIVLWDGGPEWTPPAGSTAIALAAGSPVSVDYTYDGANFEAPVQVVTLAQAQALTAAQLAASYTAAIAASVSFTSAGGVTKNYQADPGSIGNLQDVLAAFTPSGAVPNGFYWVAVDNTQVPFTLADLQGLAKVLATQGWASFQRLQTAKAALAAATTVAAVQAVTF